MKKIFLVFILLSSIVFTQEKITVNKDISLTKIGDSVYIHESYQTLENWGRVAANGMLLIENGKALMIDTPWDNEQTKVLAEYLSDSMTVQVTKVIVGHYHNDCMGGLEYLQAIGVESLANSMTIPFCEKFALPIPSETFGDSIFFTFEGAKVECRFVGSGHTVDNIVTYFPEFKILFGGCLVKAANARSIGNTEEAVIDDWDKSIEKLSEIYPEAKIIIPGHGNYGGQDTFTNTIRLVREYREELKSK